MVENWSNNWPDHLNGPHKAVTEAKNVQIKTNLFEPRHGNSINHRKEVEAEDALSEPNARTEEERGTNRDLVTTNWSNHK
jgi:hypothetical protein